ncbi:apses-domain-containing protein [Ascobolus immersus RN42]|uniref:Apses-domain-containing protein n=1 Tax=Ascobolus immersus RN42 TaxID=1160509 RepID=A0A3N4II00_ASCIM|nr:apses-domain-containing protein [Ascobolus immersus RN42]
MADLPAPTDVQIFKATYSGVPVYEFLANGIACMRRRSDGWLNATQILKVADFDKPARTRILEREVQRGKHEKVQGGYGKYQGTWVPLERGRELAQMYKVEHLLRPILDFRPSTESPPLAPKHVTAASSKPRPKTARPPTKKKKAAAIAAPIPIPLPVVDQMQVDSDLDAFDDDAMSDIDLGRGSLRSPVYSAVSNDDIEEDMTDLDHDVGAVGSLRQNRAQMGGDLDLGTTFSTTAFRNNQRVRQPYSDLLLDYFVAPPDSDVPEFLKAPPPDFKVDEIIDNEGHTAFHWAVAMGDLRVMTLLLDAGADWRAVNIRGETALMRAVLFTNSYDRKCFPKVVELLRETICDVDKFKSTVFHHIAATTTSRNKILASRYYAEVLLQKLTEQEIDMVEIGQILDMKDVYGNTALTLAARNGAKKCIRTFLAYHASPHVRNNDNLTADYYIATYQHQVQSQQQSQNSHHTTHSSNIPSSSPFQPTQSPRMQSHHYHGTPAYQLPTPQPHKSEAAIRATQKAIPALAGKLEALATAFDNELSEKEKDLEQARQLLENVERDSSHVTKCKEEFLKEVGGVELFNGEVNSWSAKVSDLEEQLIELVGKRNLSGLSEEVQNASTVNGDVDSEKELPDEEKLELAKELQKLEQNRKKLVRETVELRKKSDGRARIEEYRKLIAVCCNLPVDGVDGMLPEILKAVESGNGVGGVGLPLVDGVEGTVV